MHWLVGILMMLAQNAPSPPPGNAENGAKIFASHGCYACHGYMGQGGAAGPRIAPQPVVWPSFSRYVRTPTGQMPPYTPKVIADRELADIYAYLMSIPEPPPVESLPQLEP